MQLDPSPNTGLVTTAVAPTEFELASGQGRPGTSDTMADAGSGSTTDATGTTDATPARGTSGRFAATAPASPSPAPAVVPASTSNAAAAAGSIDAPAPARVRSRRPQLQPQIASAQQARDFLELTAAQLQSLKATLSARLAGLRTQDAQLQTQLQAVTSTWRSRSDATAGSVDAQLRFSATATALQRFSVRGLDLRSLRDGSSETLVISFAGATFDTGAMAGRSMPAGGDHASASIDIDPRLSDEALVKRFHRELSPLGLGVDVDASGALIFGVVEAAWPAVRDSLAIRGNGIRFPAGQPTRARTDAEPPTMQPQEWTARDATALRHALAEVTRALDRVQQARAAVERALADASRQVDAAPGNDGAAAQAMAEAFVSVAGRPGYQALSSVSAALVGTSRSRVATLLALPDAV